MCLTPVEKTALLELVASSSDAVVASTRDRLEGKSLAATAGTNFGRDKHEAALGSTVTSVKLNVAEVDVLRAALAASETQLRESLGPKLDLLHEALVQGAPKTLAAGQSLAFSLAAAAMVGAMALVAQLALALVEVAR